MANRLRNRSWRVLYWVLGICLAAVLWKAAWLAGPRLAGGPGAPAVFEPQARTLLKASQGLPREVHATLQPPSKGTSAEAQLRLMELWDGRAWTAKAAQAGRVQGKLLRVRAGRIVFARITAISAVKTEDGRETCRVDYKVRWDWPDPDRELLRVAAIIGLEAPAPAGFAAPGQEASRSMVLERDGWSWRPREPRPSSKESAEKNPLWSYLARIF